MSRYLDDRFNIDNPCFEGMMCYIYSLNKANASDTEGPFWNYIYLFQTDLVHPNV